MEGGPDVASIRQSLAAAGLDPSGYRPPAPVEVWPDNDVALTVFLAMQTQWSVGPNGATGLRYEALREVCTRIGVRKAEDRDTAFLGLQVMEREALLWFAERAARND